MTQLTTEQLAHATRVYDEKLAEYGEMRIARKNVAVALGRASVSLWTVSLISWFASASLWFYCFSVGMFIGAIATTGLCIVTYCSYLAMVKPTLETRWY